MKKGLCIIFLFLIPMVVHAAVPQTINYQGYLTNAGGTAVNTPVDITFGIYDVASGGPALWTETQSGVTVSNGVYSVILGSVTPIGLSFDSQYYLGIKIGTDPEMTPRQPLTGVPYAFRAGSADSVSASVNFLTSNTIISTVPTGTAPLTVSSTTAVANLNADMVDGQHAGAFAASAHSHAGSAITSAVANAADADTVDGQHAADFATAGPNTNITSLSGLNTQAAITLQPYGAAAGNTGEVRLQELTANGSNYVGFKAPDSINADRVWVLPAADGTPNQVLRTDGAGNLGWSDLAGSTFQVVTGTDPNGVIRGTNTATNSSGYLGGTYGVYGETTGNGTVAVYGKNVVDLANGYGYQGMLGTNNATICDNEPYPCNCYMIEVGDPPHEEEVCESCPATVCHSVPGAGVYGFGRHTSGYAGYFEGSVVVQGITGQPTLQEWKNNAGVTVASVDQNGFVMPSISSSNPIVSTVSTGTPPFAIASTTMVPNLNADTVDGKNAADFVLKAGDTMTGSLTLSNGNLALPSTTASAGLITAGGSPLIHSFGTNNFFAGRNAGNRTMTGYSITATGVNVLAANTTGYENTATGANALAANTTGSSNTATGVNALAANTTGTSNTATGMSALGFNTTGFGNTATGVSALAANTTGFSNTATGLVALAFNTIGTHNTATGFHALLNNTTAGRNTAVGAGALYSQSFDNAGVAWESHNTAIGYNALYYNNPTNSLNGFQNTAVGSSALRSNTTGFYNTANGFSALYSNTNGKENTAMGYEALHGNITGDYNTAIGRGALLNNVIGGYNTAIGYAADVSGQDMFNATAIGYDAVVNASNKVRIGNTSVTVIEGQVGWSYPSDIRLKKDVSDIGHGLAFIKSLRPVQYRLIQGNDRIDFGFIAQEVETELGDGYNVLGIGEDAERTLSLRYTDFIAPMVKAMQEQQEIIEAQKAEIDNLKMRLAAIEALLTGSK